MAGGGMNQYSPQQQYGWQGPNQAQAQQMHPLPVPGPSVPYGQVPGGSGVMPMSPVKGLSSHILAEQHGRERKWRCR